MTDLLITGVDNSRPLSVAQTTTGETFIANGMMKPRRWNAIDLTVQNAGVPQAPATLSASDTGLGGIHGKYYIATRYVDKEGIPGNLSTATSFTASTAQKINYSGLPVPTDTRVDHKQVWRTTADESTTFYLDVDNIDTNATTSSSSKIDGTLNDADALPVLNLDGTLNARRFGVPPDFKSVVVTHQNRTFWGVNPVVSEGHAELTSGSTAVKIIGANLSAQLVGRVLYVPGHGHTYTISAYSSSISQLTVSTAFRGPTNMLANYEIQVSNDERNRIYFSEADEPESVPVTNAVDLVHSDYDEGSITALMSMGAFLWIMTPNRTYRWTYQQHPINDGNIYLTISRGCVNQRCWTLVDGNAYILDQQGCYVFNGGTATPISRPIHNFFTSGGGIVWDKKDWFHVGHDLQDEVVKFYVCLDGSPQPKHALCYHYRSNAWTVEEYPWPVPANTPCGIGPNDRLLVGTTHGRVMLASQGLLDGPRLALTARQSPTAVGEMSLTIGDTFTASDLVYATVQVVSGRGQGELRRIVHADSSGVLYLDEPWHEAPDTDSVIQIGGVRWSLKTRLFRLLDTERESNRSIVLVYTPVTASSSLDLAIYKSMSASPAPFVVSYDRLDGLETNQDKNAITIALDENPEGVVYWAFDDQQDFRGPATKLIQFGLSGVQNTEQIVLHAIEVAGVRK